MLNPTIVYHIVEMLHLELMFGLVCKCFTFEQNFYEQVVDEVLLVKEDTMLARFFQEIPNFQDDNALFDRHNKCKTILVDFMDC
jgi:hypothetical protein